MMEMEEKVQEALKKVFGNDPEKLRGYVYTQIWKRCKSIFDLQEAIEAEKKKEKPAPKKMTRLRNKLKDNIRTLKSVGIIVSTEEGKMKIEFTQSTRTETTLQGLIKEELHGAMLGVEKKGKRKKAKKRGRGR